MTRDALSFQEAGEDQMDTGDIAEVPEDQRLDEDGGEGSDASDDVITDDDLSEIYENPGEVIEEDLA